MLIHDQVLAALRRALEQAGFAIFRQRDIGPAGQDHIELRFVRDDRLGLEPPAGATIALCEPDVAHTTLLVLGHSLGPDEAECAQIDLNIGYHIPFPAYLDLEDGILAAWIARDYLLSELMIDLPEGWEVSAELDVADEANPFDDVFSVHCMAFQGGAGLQSIEIILEHIWVFERDQPHNEAELEGDIEALVSMVSHVWDILVPPGYEDDPLAPLSFLLPREDVLGAAF
jgi:hypothetical protein